MKPPITIKQLAHMMGMSHSTVSRALNEHPAISTETKYRVHQMAAQLGYVPNSAARVLRNEPSGIVGLVIPDIRNEFYTTVAKTIAEAAALRSRQLILATTDDQPGREYFAVHSLFRVRAEGVIITPTGRPEQETLALLARMKVVQLVRVHSGITAPSVVIADRLGIELAVSHLLELGHKSIAYIGASEELSTGRERLEGFRSGFVGSGRMAEDKWICTGPPRPHFGAEALKTLMRAPGLRPSAIVLGSPELAFGVLSAAQEEGIAIPEDLSLVGYGDIHWSALVAGGLTTVALPEQAVADKSVELLLNGLDAALTESTLPAEPLDQRNRFKPHLTIRGSTRRFT